MGNDLIGMRFHELIVESAAESRNHNRYWLCRCDCGKTRECPTQKLTSGQIKRCKYHRESHGDAGDKLYNTWKRINQRCSNPNVERYPHYGGRGIENRFESYRDFKKWSLANGFAQGLSIDRIDNDGHYCPENCRWSNDFTQMRNTTRNPLTSEQIAFLKGDRRRGFTLSELARKYAVSKGLVAAACAGRTWADVEPV